MHFGLCLFPQLLTTRLPSSHTRLLPVHPWAPGPAPSPPSSGQVWYCSPHRLSLFLHFLPHFIHFFQHFLSFLVILSTLLTTRLPSSSMGAAHPPWSSILFTVSHKFSTNIISFHFLTPSSKMLTAPGIPRRSPIQVLTGPDLAWLPRSDEIGHGPGGMAVNDTLLPGHALVMQVSHNQHTHSDSHPQLWSSP